MPSDPRGFTIVEACIVLAVLALLLATAVPSIRNVLQRRALRGSAEELRADLHFLKARSAARGERLWLSLLTSAQGSCYVLHSGPRTGCRCTPDGTPGCDATAQALKTVGFADPASLRMQANASDIAIEPHRGMASPSGTFRLLSGNGEEIRVMLSLSGRVRSCSPDGQVAGYKPC